MNRIRNIAHQSKLLQYSNGHPTPVITTAKLLASSLRYYKGNDLSVGTMVSGIDDSGPHIYYVDSEGNLVSGDVFCVGSGATLAYAVLDSTKDLKHMCMHESADLALWAIRHATHRDGYSGGYINVYCIDETGVCQINRIDSKDLKII